MKKIVLILTVFLFSVSVQAKDTIIYYAGFANTGSDLSIPYFNKIYIDETPYYDYADKTFNAINRKINRHYRLQYFPSARVHRVVDDITIYKKDLEKKQVLGLVLIPTLEMEHKLSIDAGNQKLKKYEFITGVSAILVEHSSGKVKVAANALGYSVYQGNELSNNRKAEFFAKTYHSTALDALDKLSQIKKSVKQGSDALMITKVLLNSSIARTLFHYPDDGKCEQEVCNQFRNLVAQGVANAYSISGMNMLPPLNITSWGRYLEVRNNVTVVGGGNSDWGGRDYMAIKERKMRIIAPLDDSPRHVHVSITGMLEKAVSTGKYFHIWGFKSWMKAKWCDKDGNYKLKVDEDWCNHSEIQGGSKEISSKRPVYSHKVTSTDHFKNNKRRNYYIAAILKTIKEFEKYAKQNSH
jgi:hypothetical protein